MVLGWIGLGGWGGCGGVGGKMNINKTSSDGWFGRDGLEEKAKSGWGGQGGQGVLLGKTTLSHPNNNKKTDFYN